MRGQCKCASWSRSILIFCITWKANDFYNGKAIVVMDSSPKIKETIGSTKKHAQ